MVLLSLDLLFLAPNLIKLVHCAWLPLAIAIAAYTVMTTWQRGREVVTTRREAMEGSQREFVDELADNPDRARVVDGTATFFNAAATPRSPAVPSRPSRLTRGGVIVACDNGEGDGDSHEEGKPF